MAAARSCATKMVSMVQNINEYVEVLEHIRSPPEPRGREERILHDEILNYVRPADDEMKDMISYWKDVQKSFDAQMGMHISRSQIYQEIDARPMSARGRIEGLISRIKTHDAPKIKGDLYEKGKKYALLGMEELLDCIELPPPPPYSHS